MTALTVEPGTPELADLTDEAVAVAAKWWADCLRRPKNKDNGVAIHGVMGDMIAERSAGKTAELADAFEAALRAEILSDDNPHYSPSAREGYALHKKLDMSRGRIAGGRESMRVDYGPCAVLQRAIVSAEPGAKPNGQAFSQSKIADVLPWKTDVRISAVAVSVGAGYQSKIEPHWCAWETALVSTTLVVRDDGRDDGRVRDHAHLGPAVRVVDRWEYRPPHFHQGKSGWLRGGDPTARVAYITLDPNSVEPLVIARVLRGRVAIQGYGSSVEEILESSFREETTRGYLALVRPT